MLTGISTSVNNPLCQTMPELNFEVELLRNKAFPPVSDFAQKGKAEFPSSFLSVGYKSTHNKHLQDASVL